MKTLSHLTVHISILVCAILLVTGCVSSRSGNVYSRRDARQVHTVDYGRVISVRHVQIEGTQSHFGTLAGAIIGGVIGSTIGSGSGRTLATVGGAVAGGMAGTAMEEDATRRNGLEIEVDMDSGDTLVIVQEDDIDLRPGDRVRVLTARDGSARVSF
ncbi:MAG: glycine zipper 2TM domain-containing protein [Desulfobacteraceae bacterium]|nr:MAG: glycine zipper 2TM domain-containing protein [Desulfobacteraceae bacterium]